jgi:hypothetical protein
MPSDPSIYSSRGMYFCREQGHRWGSGRGALVPGILIVIMVLCGAVASEPVIITGAQMPLLLGERIAKLRMIDASGRPIPFQIDERTTDGEFVCDRGDASNDTAGNGLLDTTDEIVFLREDASPVAGGTSPSPVPVQVSGGLRYPVIIGSDGNAAIAYVTDDPSVDYSPVRYIRYDHATQYLETPWYFAQFAVNRFHFIRAGIRGADGASLLPLTKELRVEIFLRALWGILPIHYTEDNLVCFVKRYKAGPVRLIRRGDFHLNVGLGLRGSRAAVNQICYPDLVSVPVSVHLPVRFGLFFREAWLEMSPVIDRAGGPFTFSIDGTSCRFSAKPGGGGTIDTLVACTPDRTPFSLLEAGRGFGWMLSTDMPGTSSGGSGFIFRRPSSRSGIADCGFKLMIRDVPRGRYRITNWICFTREGQADIVSVFNRLNKPPQVRTPGVTEPDRSVDKLLPSAVRGRQPPDLR